MEQRIALIIALMKADLHKKPSLEKLARRVGLSPSRLRHLFKAEMGVSPTQHHKVLRMQAAKDLLETTFLSVKEIRCRVGIEDKDQFTRDFKRFYGTTPAQYQAQRHASFGKEMAN